MKDLSIINKNRVLSMTKSDITSIAKAVSEEIKEGSGNPLETLLSFKKLAELSKLIENNIKVDVMNSLKLGEKEVYKANNAEITTMETSVKYDYASSGDSVWIELNSQIKELQSKIKEREKFLKAIPDEGMVNAETGEVIKKPIKKSSQTLKITIK